MGSSIQRGDPAHVLLDILDSDRTHFTDNMIDIPIDLSNIIFVATANNIEKISPILLDRLEIIKLRGYTNEEKSYIERRPQNSVRKSVRKKQKERKKVYNIDL